MVGWRSQLQHHLKGQSHQIMDIIFRSINFNLIFKFHSLWDIYKKCFKTAPMKTLTTYANFPIGHC
jgi:hypothetical protein